MGSRAGLVLAAAFAILFVGGGARFGIGLTFKPMVEELGWARGELGLAVGMYLVVSAAATFVSGRLADRISLRALLTAGTILNGVGIGLMSTVREPWHALALYGLVFALGGGIASFSTVAVMVTRSFPERTGFFNAAAMAGSSLGQLVMIAALAAALAALGWRSVFVWLGLAHLVLIPLLTFAPTGGPKPREEATRPELDLRGAARTRAFWLLLGVYALCGLDDFFVGTHVVAFAQDKGLDALLAGNLLALMGLTSLVGVLLAGHLADRWGSMRVTAGVFAARIAVFALIVLDQSPVSIAIYALVFGATFFMTAPLTILFVRDYFGTRSLGAISGLVTTVHQIFGGIGAWGGAVIFDATGTYDAAFVVVLASAVLGVALTLSLPPVRGRTR